MSPVSRRKFIIGLTAAAGGAAVLVIGTRHTRGKKLMFQLKDLLPDPDAMHEAGRLYLRRYPEEHDLDRLVDEMLPGTFLGLRRVKPQKLHQLMHDKIRSDYEKSQVISLDGWILSLTEIRLYSLVHLALESSG